MTSQIVSVQEARKILGKDAEGMSDEEIEFVIGALDLMARDQIKNTKRKLLMKRDAYRLANLVYDIYKESQSI